MNRNVVFASVFLVAVCCGWSLVGAADPPTVVNYQGVLRDSADMPLDGLYDMAFRFYSAETGGDFIMQDFHANAYGSPVVVTHGLFNVPLGTGDVRDGPGPGSYFSLAEVFRDYGTVYLHIEVGPADQPTEVLTPRVPIRSAPYALNAGQLAGFDASSFLQGSLTTDSVPRWNGSELEDGLILDHGNSVEIGTTSNPVGTFSVEGPATFDGGWVNFYDTVVITSGSQLRFSDSTVQTTAAAPLPDPPCYDDANRFVDCGNGTVTDTFTGLIWLKDADCWQNRIYSIAHYHAQSLASGQCGLSDRSIAGQWRLPTREEWADLIRQAVIDGCTYPTLLNANRSGCWSEGDPFINVVSGYYWSSTGSEDSPNGAWRVLLSTGTEQERVRTDGANVWPVRSGR